MPTDANFEPGEEVFFDIPNYGAGKGNIAAFYIHTDGTKLYAIYPKTQHNSSNYKYVCLIVPETELVSTPF